MRRIILPQEIEKRVRDEAELREKEKILSSKVKREDKLRKRKDQLEIQFPVTERKLTEEERRQRRLRNKNKKFRHLHFRNRKKHGR